MHPRIVYDFFQTEKHISRIKLESTDEIAAINSAREELIITTKLFTLENKHKQYYPGNLSEAIDNSRKEVKLHYFVKFLATNKQKALDIYVDRIIEQRYICLINKYLSLRGNKLWLEEYLDALKGQVHSDFLRAYRMRNILAHQASVDEEFLDEIYDVMTFYLKLILDDLLYTIILQPNNSVHDLVKIKSESYEEYLKELRNHKKNGRCRL